MAEIQIEQVKTTDPEVLEAWERSSNEPYLLGVSAVRLADDSWPWQVAVSMAAYVREEPLKSQLYEAVTDALQNVPGVACVEHEEPGIWVLDGSFSGRDLVLAVSVVVDRLAPAARTK